MKPIKYDVKCDNCGRFIKYEDIGSGNATLMFIPDSDVSHEEIKFRCPKCTIKLGKPISNQPFINGNY